MLRIATQMDAPRISAIYAHYVENSVITFEELAPSVDEMAAKIEKVLQRYPWIVLEEGGQVRGYAYVSQYRERAAYRWSVEDSVYLDHNAMGRGRGAILLSALLSIVKAQGFAKVYAVITPPNPASVALHRRLGFSPLCRFPNTAYKRGAWQSIDWMEKSLFDPEDFTRPTAPAEPEPFSSFSKRYPSRLAALLGS